MKYRRIIFWQETPSPHQAPWIRALAQEVQGCEVLGVFQKGLSQDRRALGWQPPDYGKVPVIISPDPSTIKNLLAGDTESTVHIFSGTVHNSSINSACRDACSTKAVIGILSEGRDWRGWKGGLRQVYALFHERRYRQRVDFVLAIGHLAMRWFTRSGYEAAKLFPFCYVVENDGSCLESHLVNKSVTIASVGQLIPRKRFDLLLRALARIPDPAWKLKIIGNGIQRRTSENMANDLGIRNRTIFMGILENQRVRQELAKTDIFVLCSRWDGWGAVVNEALMSGVPVICSDYCGAADLIRPSFNGEIFRSNSLESLLEVLNRWISKGPLNEKLRDNIISWSRCIQGNAVANYFIEILDYLRRNHGRRPRTPWEISNMIQ